MMFSIIVYKNQSHKLLKDHFLINRMMKFKIKKIIKK